MELFHGRPHIDFVGNRWAYFTISGLLFAFTIFALVTRGINYSIDFTGGSLVQLHYETPQTLEGLRTDLGKAGYGEAIPQHFTGGGGQGDTFAVRLKGSEQESHEIVDKVVAALQAADPAKKFTVERKEFVGPTVGHHLFKQAMLAVFFSLVAIVIYVAFRFSNLVWGVAGIVALGHDVFCLFGVFSFFRMEFDLVLVAAALTIAGYSINDTIVVFDRMREKMHMSRGDAPLGEVINNSINETLSRTVITSLTVILTLIAFVLLGGPVLFNFSSSLLFGVIVGTYSSIAIAAPIVYQWEMGGWKTKVASSLPGAAKAQPSAPQPQPLAGAPAASPQAGAGASEPAEDRRSRRERRKNRR